jgi:hypothetical protein
MTKTAFLGSLALVLLAGAVGAQENTPPADDPQQDEVAQDERATDSRPQIKVLGNPYDLASYYRSSQGGGFLDYRPEGSSYQDRYPIASYYRLRSSGDRRGYGPFWTNGYSSSRRPRFVVGFRRRIGENGDLFLFAPTFLSPIGPLTDAFFDR